MARRATLDLSSLDDKLLDGLKFCTRVYDLFDHVRSEPGGIGRLRLQSGKREKRLIEELIPIAQYIQARYHLGNRFKIRWLSGSQSFDAVVWTPLPMVRNGGRPRKITLEVTSSRHELLHLSRKHLQETGGSFGPKGIKLDEKTGTPSFSPYAYTNDEHVNDLVQQIIERLVAKGKKPYPKNSVLIVNCETDGLILPDEWRSAVQEVESQGHHNSFREVFLFSPVGNLSATLWGSNRTRAANSSVFNGPND